MSIACSAHIAQAPYLELLPDAARPVVKVCGANQREQEFDALPPHPRLKCPLARCRRLLHRLLRASWDGQGCGRRIC